MDVATLASVELLEATPGGRAELRRLGDFWREAPCVLAFLRHFG